MKLDPDGRLRTLYSVAGTTTGRLNSTQTPWETGWNSQNVPPWFRKAVIPDEGYILGAVDLKQAEAVLTYYFAGAEKAIKYVEEGGDAHVFGASCVFRIPPDRVTKEQRKRAKPIVHGSHYCLGVTHAAEMAGTTVKEIKEARKNYFSMVPEVLEWHREIEKTVIEKRLLVNPFGRRRIFLDPKGERLVRKAVAFLPQSTCVDITLHAMLRLVDAREDPVPQLRGLDGFLMLQIHDEVVFQFKPSDLDRVKALIKEAYDVPVPIGGRTCRIKVEFKTGPNWGEMNECSLEENKA